MKTTSRGTTLYLMVGNQFVRDLSRDDDDRIIGDITFTRDVDKALTYRDFATANALAQQLRYLFESDSARVARAVTRTTYDAVTQQELDLDAKMRRD